MGRAPCCDKDGLKKGPWTPEEDQKLVDYIQKHGYGNWRTLPKNAGIYFLFCSFKGFFLLLFFLHGEFMEIFMFNRAAEVWEELPSTVDELSEAGY